MNGSITVCCTFIKGTDAKGCVIVLEDENGSTEYVKLDRTGNTLFVKSHEVSPNLTLAAVKKMFALDIESDGTNGTFPIPATIGLCSGPGGGEDLTTGW